jgi:hypothetical protein
MNGVSSGVGAKRTSEMAIWMDDLLPTEIHWGNSNFGSGFYIQSGSTTLLLIDVGRQSPCPGIIRYAPQKATGLDLESGGEWRKVEACICTEDGIPCLLVSPLPPRSRLATRLHPSSAEAALT